MEYCSFHYFDVDHCIFFPKENFQLRQNDEEVYPAFEKKLARFKDDDVHKGLGFCPCRSRNRVRRPNIRVHLFKQCASVIYGLSFHGNFCNQKLILATDQSERSRLVGKHLLANWNEKSKCTSVFRVEPECTRVFRIDFVHIEPHIIKHDPARDGIDDIKDWRKNVYGLVGARRRRKEEQGRDYPPAGLVFFRDWNAKTPYSADLSVAVSPDGQLLLNGPFLPVVAWEDEAMVLDIKLYCSAESSEQTVMMDLRSCNNDFPRGSIEPDQPKIFRADGLHGSVTVRYSVISRAVYVRFVAGIVIPSTASPLDIYGHITVEEHFHENQKSYLFYAERESCQQLKHGDYLTLYMDSMTLQEGKELIISVSLYQRSPSSTSKTDDIIFVDGHTSFSPSLTNNEEENQQQKNIQSDDDDQKGNGINFDIGIMDPRHIKVLQI